MFVLCKYTSFFVDHYLKQQKLFNVSNAFDSIPVDELVSLFLGSQMDGYGAQVDILITNVDDVLFVLDFLAHKFRHSEHKSLLIPLGLWP